MAGLAPAICFMGPWDHVGCAKSPCEALQSDTGPARFCARGWPSCHDPAVRGVIVPRGRRRVQIRPDAVPDSIALQGDFAHPTRPFTPADTAIRTSAYPNRSARYGAGSQNGVSPVII